MTGQVAHRVAIVAGLIGIACLMVRTFVPAPSSAQFTRAKLRQKQQFEHKTKVNLEKIAELKQANADRLWDKTPAEVSTEVMTMLSNAGKTLNVDVTNFRPQRVVDDKNIRQLPYTVTLSGRFAAITAFCSALDGPAKKVVLKSLQINAADQNNETVTASIGLVAYVPLETPAK